MHKILNTLLAAVLFAATLLFCASCNDNKKPSNEFDPDANLDTEHAFFDDFTTGISSEHWTLGNSKWGTGNGGVLPQNVHYTEDGIVVLQCNGDNYVGELKGHGNDHGRRTGATIITRENLGPGRFEVRMKCLPRFGSTTAFWTYAFEDGRNHEIDIELNVNQDFTSVWNTNWHTVDDFSHYETKTDIINNDGEWHTYKFEWHTNPERIDYYIDDVPTYTAYAYVPTIGAGLNIGNWFPDGWAGTPDFETDYTFVDWFRYTPYLNNTYEERDKSPASPEELYPTSPIEMPEPNLISNAQMESTLEIPVNMSKLGANAWRQSKQGGENVSFPENAGIDGSTAVCLKNGHSIYQYVSGVHESFELYLSGYAKNVIGSGRIKIDFMPLTSSVLGSTTLEFNGKTDFSKLDKTFTLPEGTQRLRITLAADENSEILFDNLFCNLSKKSPKA